MNNETPSKLIAVVGGSGAGKSWLASRLREEFGSEATSLSLDDFYCDLSHLMLSEREKINFDHPDTIDWPLFEAVLRDLRNGLSVTLPKYDFVTHNRMPFGELQNSLPLIIVEGLWLLWPEHVRELFDLRIFLDCSESLRWQRRLARDLETRGRTTNAICEQFWNVVAPMHEHFVEVQKARADLVIEQPTSTADFNKVASAVRALQTEPGVAPLEIIHSQTTTPEIAALHSL